MNIQDVGAQMPNYEVYQAWQRPDPIEGIVIHHSGRGTVDEHSAPTLSAQGLAEYHVHREGRAHASYHYVVQADGAVLQLLDEAIPGYHATLPEPPRSASTAWQRWQAEWQNGQRLNRRTLAVLVMGWFDAERHVNGTPIGGHMTPTAAQQEALLQLLQGLIQRHGLSVGQIEGHHEALARAGFGTTTCPGTQWKMEALRTAMQDRIEPIQVPGPPPLFQPPLLTNRPLIGLHGRNDDTFTPTDWQIVQGARVESLKTMSFTRDEVYAFARTINPQMEFIVRLYAGSPGRGAMPTPLQFADRFRETMERLHHQFGVLKFEIHNEPNHPDGLEGWGKEYADAVAFGGWYRQTFGILRQRHSWALLGYPGLAIPHNDLQWLDWNREAIEMSDWLGVHCYWQTPPGHEENYQSDFWALRFKYYHEKFPHKTLEITEFGNSNGQTPGLSLSRAEQQKQYRWWMQRIQAFPYLGSAHGFIATSPDPRWQQEGFTWGDEQGPYPVASAIGALSRPPRLPDWYYVFAATMPAQVPPSTRFTFPVALGNGGRLPWRRLGVARTIIFAKWCDTDGKVLSTTSIQLLPRDMRAGERVEFTMTARTRPQPGDYKLRLALFHVGHNQWLHELDDATAPDFFPVTVAVP